MEEAERVKQMPIERLKARLWRLLDRLNMSMEKGFVFGDWDAHTRATFEERYSALGF